MNTNPSPEGSIELDDAELLVIVDNETDTLSSIDTGVPQLPEIARVAARVPTTRYGTHDGTVVFDKLCCACHGYSVLVTGHAGGNEHVMLFDVGPYPDVWLDNAERLGVNLASIECLFLSHWHFDHSGGFPAVVAAIAQARRAEGLDPLVVDVHPDRPDRRGVATPAGTLLMLPDEPTADQFRDAGAEVEIRDDAHALCDGFFFASGEIARITDYETGLEGHISFRGDTAAADPLIMDERFVAVRVAGRGTSVLTACSHAGVVNACLAARAAFAGAPIDVVLGGYHLAGAAMEARTERTVRDLRDRVAPRVIAPGHCTGWRARAALADAFAPGGYGPSAVGTSYRLTAQRTAAV